MRLLITTPVEVVVDQRNVVCVRAEDESGGFGILPGHTDLLTALTVSVVSWRCADGGSGFCAVRHGVLEVRSGTEVAIATREATPDKDLEHLEHAVLTKFHEKAEAERSARSKSLQQQMKAIRQIVRYVRPQRLSAFGEGS